MHKFNCSNDNYVNLTGQVISEPRIIPYDSVSPFDTFSKNINEILFYLRYYRKDDDIDNQDDSEDSFGYFDNIPVVLMSTNSKHGKLLEGSHASIKIYDDNMITQRFLKNYKDHMIHVVGEIREGRDNNNVPPFFVLATNFDVGHCISSEHKDKICPKMKKPALPLSSINYDENPFTSHDKYVNPSLQPYGNPFAENTWNKKNSSKSRN